MVGENAFSLKVMVGSLQDPQSAALAKVARTGAVRMSFVEGIILKVVKEIDLFSEESVGKR